MKLSRWAKEHDLHYKTAWIMFNKGLIKGAYKLPTGTILVEDEEKPREKKVVVYARVSSADQKEDLKRQVERLKAFCLSANLDVASVVQEIGSGLNGKRKKLISLLRDKEITHIIVEHRDRLVRFGFEMIEASLNSNNRKIIIVDEDEFKDDLVQDFVDLATSMCAKIYGRRSAKNRAKKAIEAANNED